MRPSEAEGAGIMWFTEGFAEFYMRRIAYRAGRISGNDYLWHLNRALLEYAKSSVNQIPNSRIFSDFGRTTENSRLPYVRGQMVAILVDAQIRRSSGNLRSLDDLVRALADGVRKTEMGVTTESVLKVIGTATSQEFEARVRRVVLNGEPAGV